MSKYDHGDFLANPKKYELYSTADVVRHLFGENGQDVPEGTSVGVRFLGIRRNQLYKDECRGYIQGWLQGQTVTDKTAQRIFGATEKILKAGRKVEEATA